MPDLSILLWLIPLGVVFHYLWRSGKFKGRAREIASRHCSELNLQLLDQSMVITGFWPARNNNANFVMRRSYQFEFTSTGARRYQGIIVLVGLQLSDIELEAYIIPGADHPEPVELETAE
jgi:hypothetical protein